MNVILKLSYTNMARHKDRAAFTIIGLALALGVLFFVYNIAAAYQGNVSNTFNYITRNGINLWITPIHSFYYDARTQLIFVNGSLPYNDYLQIYKATLNGSLPTGTTVFAEIINKTQINNQPFVVWGTTRLSNSSSPLQVYMNQQAASALGVTIGQQFTLAGQRVVFAQDITGLPTTQNLIVVPLNLANLLLNHQAGPPLEISWILVRAPLLKLVANWVSNNMNFIESTSPLAALTPMARGIEFILPAGFYRFQVVSFSSQLSAISLSRVVSTTYGLLANICLGLGFVLVVSTAILNMEERRRELGIWSAIGIAEDAFLVFLVETVLVYAVALTIGFIVGITLSAFFAPWTLQPNTLVATFLVITPYFPILIIAGSLIPLQMLLNKKPLDLLLKR
jgi:hypothetical protein